MFSVFNAQHKNKKQWVKQFKGLDDGTIIDFLQAMLSKKEEYLGHVQQVGIQFWCKWVNASEDAEKKERIALLVQILPVDLQNKKGFQALLAPSKKRKSTFPKQGKTKKTKRIRIQEASENEDPAMDESENEDPAMDESENEDPAMDESENEKDPDIDEQNFDDDPAIDLSELFHKLSWIQEDSNQTTIAKSRKRKSPDPADKVITKKARLEPGVEILEPNEDDKALCGEDSEALKTLTFLSKCPKKYEAFKALLSEKIAEKTPYALLKEIGFKLEQILLIVCLKGGSYNLKALQAIFNEQERVQQLLHFFTDAKLNVAEKLTKILKHSGGYNNLAALQALTVQAIDQDQTPLQQLKEVEFEPSHIVSILANNGGYNNLAALQALTVQVTDQDQTPLQQLKKAGFEPSHIVNILANNGGYKNLAALQALTVQATDQDQTPLQQLKKAGFEPSHIVSILANNGGYKNLAALQALTVQVTDQDQTPLQQLKEVEFEPSHIVSILANNGGYKNLAALQALTVQVTDQDQTPLQQLKKAGFEPSHIVSILAHDGGYKNLAALQALTVQAIDQDQTPLQQLKEVEFEPSHIVSILANNGGYKNLAALQALTVQVTDQDQTPLQQLKKAGFEPSHIVNILANNGGYKNLKALLNFMPHYLGFTALEKTAFLSFVSKVGASTRVKLAQRLIKHHGDGVNKASLFDFLKSATNKSVAQFESLSLEQLVEQIKSKKARRVSAERSKKTQPAVAAPADHLNIGTVMTYTRADLDREIQKAKNEGIFYAGHAADSAKDRLSQLKTQEGIDKVYFMRPSSDGKNLTIVSLLKSHEYPLGNQKITIEETNGIVSLIKGNIRYPSFQALIKKYRTSGFKSLGELNLAALSTGPFSANALGTPYHRPSVLNATDYHSGTELSK